MLFDFFSKKERLTCGLDLESEEGINDKQPKSAPDVLIHGKQSCPPPLDGLLSEQTKMLRQNSKQETQLPSLSETEGAELLPLSDSRDQQTAKRSKDLCKIACAERVLLG